jgi:hypothetical protein
MHFRTASAITSWWRTDNVTPGQTGDLFMGRSFLSVRQGINLIAERWARASRTLVREDKAYGRKTADLAKKYASEAFVGCDDPLEGAVFSAMVELGKRRG